MTKCTASWEPSDVSFQSNKDLKIGGDHFKFWNKTNYNTLNFSKQPIILLDTTAASQGVTVKDHF